VSDPFLRALPKVQLHCHLEGTVRPATLLELAAAAGMHLEPDPYAFATFEEFLRVFCDVCRALTTPDAFERIAREYAEGAREEGVRSAEIFFSPSVWSFFNPGIDVDACLRAVRRGLDVGSADALDVALICDLTRNLGPQSAQATAERAAGDLWRELGVIGVGLGGDEVNFPARSFADVFAFARREGLHAVAHAGEADGAASIREAIEIGSERIGHGIRAIEDPSLVERLARERIPLEIAPTSNRRTGVWPAERLHPLAALDEAGVVVAIDADDPAIFGVSLLDEYATIDATLGRATTLRLARCAIDASFASEERKAALRAELSNVRSDGWPHALR